MEGADLEIPGYVVCKKIGTGSFATVFLAQKRGSLEEVAIKIINKSRLNEKLQESLSSEIKTMASINHQNIVKLLDIQGSQEYLFIVMEYCDGGDLATAIKREKRFSQPLVQEIVGQLACALEKLRSMSVIHRDLKPQNILLSHAEGRDLRIKVADFGFARALDAGDLVETLCGSPLYMAPEILRYEKYDAKADLWSVGIIMFEMLTGEPPFKADNHIQLQKLIDSTEMNQLIDSRIRDADLACLKLLKGLLTKNPQDRLSFDQFFSHPFLTSKLDQPKVESLTTPEAESGLPQVIMPPFARQYLSKSGTSSRYTPRSWSLSERAPSSGTSGVHSITAQSLSEKDPSLILGALLGLIEENFISKRFEMEDKQNLFTFCREVHWMGALVRTLRHSDGHFEEYTLPQFKRILAKVEEIDQGLYGFLTLTRDETSVISMIPLHRLSTTVLGIIV